MGHRAGASQAGAAAGPSQAAAQTAWATADGGQRHSAWGRGLARLAVSPPDRKRPGRAACDFCGGGARAGCRALAARPRSARGGRVQPHRGPAARPAQAGRRGLPHPGPAVPRPGRGAPGAGGGAGRARPCLPVRPARPAARAGQRPAAGAGPSGGAGVAVRALGDHRPAAPCRAAARRHRWPPAAGGARHRRLRLLRRRRDAARGGRPARPALRFALQPRPAG